MVSDLATPPINGPHKTMAIPELINLIESSRPIPFGSIGIYDNQWKSRLRALGLSRQILMRAGESSHGGVREARRWTIRLELTKLLLSHIRENPSLWDGRGHWQSNAFAIRVSFRPCSDMSGGDYRRAFYALIKPWIDRALRRPRDSFDVPTRRRTVVLCDAFHPRLRENNHIHAVLLNQSGRTNEEFAAAFHLKASKIRIVQTVHCVPLHCPDAVVAHCLYGISRNESEALGYHPITLLDCELKLDVFLTANSSLGLAFPVRS